MATEIKKLVLNNQFIAGIIFILLLFFLYYIRDVLVVIFVAFIFMSALSPFVEYLRKNKFPKIAAVAIPYLLSVILLFAIIFPLIPFFISQIQNLVEKFPTYLDQSFKLLRISVDSINFQDILKSQIRTIGENAFMVSSKILSSFFTFLTIMILTLYLLLDHGKIRKGFTHLFSVSVRKKIYITLVQVEEKLGAWLRGQIALSLVIGIMTWIALIILGIDFALPLAVMAAILEIVPTIGPILSAIPTIIVALNEAPTLALIVIAVYIIIQIIESNLVVPIVMQQAVGFSPIVIIVSIIIGGKLMGIEGALLAIPFVSAITVIFKTAFKSDKKTGAIITYGNKES